jgi:hypothetical protein
VIRDSLSIGHELNTQRLSSPRIVLVIRDESVEGNVSYVEWMLLQVRSLGMFVCELKERQFYQLFVIQNTEGLNYEHLHVLS